MRTTKKTLLLQALAAVATIFTLHEANGIGLRIPNQDAEAIARGNAFAATADNPSALYYNPAGITQLEGQHFQFGVLSYLGLNSDFRAANGLRQENEEEILPIPQIYTSTSIKNTPLTFGFGVYAPFGLGMKWPEDSPLRTLAIEGRLTYITVNPVLAWKIHPTLSVAAGPTLNYSRVKLRQGIGGPVPNDEFKFKGDDFAPGFNLGILWQPHDQWSFGLNYRSATTVDYRGHTDLMPYVTGLTTKASVDFPHIISGGVSFRPTPNWNIEVNVDWSDWNSVDKLTFEGAKNFFGADIVLPLDWQSSFFYHFGVTRFFDHGYFVSAGYFFSENSTSDPFFTPVVPDTDLHVGSIGFGHRGKNWNWALASQIIAGPWNTVNGSLPSPTGQSADGKFRLFSPTVSFSIGYHF